MGELTTVCESWKLAVVDNFLELTWARKRWKWLGTKDENEIEEVLVFIY